MKLSGVLIVKNEQELLSRCLDSIQGVDELIIVDTGSTDNTIEIAKKYTDKIYHFKWCDSFCKARNFANSKATGDFILSIDADEYLNTPIEKVREAINTSEELLRVKVRSEKGDIHMFPKLFRNSKDIYWQGDIHNYLNKTGTVDTDIEIIYGYSPAHQLDPDRSLRILSKVVKENPASVRERYYLAREYYYRSKWGECITELKEYLKVATWLPEKNEANLLMAKCLAKLGKYNEACDSAWEAIKYNANFKEAIEFIAEHMDPVNKQRWYTFANTADNSNVLFIRDTHVPMSLHQKHIDKIKDILKGYKEVKVLEWGAGYSTKYFPDFLRNNNIKYHWAAIEHDKDWYERVKGFNTPNVDLVLADKDSKEYLSPKGKFDFIYIDGRNRVKCLQRAKKLLKPNGVVCLHDADRTKYHVGFKGYKYEILPETPSLWVGSLMV